MPGGTRQETSRVVSWVKTIGTMAFSAVTQPQSL